MSGDDVNRFFSSLSATHKAVLALLGALFVGLSVGWGGHAFLSEQANLPERVSRLEEAVGTLVALDAMAFRLRMIEETLCNPSIRDSLGATRNQYCERVAFIQTYGLTLPE